MSTLPKLDVALTPQHSPTWFWPGATEEGMALIGSALQEAGYSPERFSFGQQFQQQWPMLIHPQGHEMPFYRVGSYELNPGRWLSYMQNGAFQQLEDELLAAQQPVGGSQQPVSGNRQQLVGENQQPPEEIVALFNQYFGGYSPEQRAQLVPLVESLIRYFGGTP